MLLAMKSTPLKMSHVGVGCVLVVSSRHFDKMRRVERTDGDGLLLDQLTDRYIQPSRFVGPLDIIACQNSQFYSANDLSLCYTFKIVTTFLFEQYK
jgi:hypothetical protein